MSATNPITGKQKMDKEHVMVDKEAKEAPPAPKADPTGGRGFGALMQDAVKLKEDQMKSGKKRWDSCGTWRQHTLFHGETEEAVREGRKLSTEAQMKVAIAIKDEGGQCVKNNNLQGAMDKYERSLALLWYFEATVDNWKKLGIQDANMKLVDLRDETNDPEMKKTIGELTGKILTNIALIKTKQEKWGESVKACDDALVINPTWYKALYIRGKARLSSKSSGGTEYQMSLNDLNRACELKPNDKGIALVRDNLKRSLKQQNVKDKKQFAGMFNRGEIVKEKKPEQKKKEIQEKKAQQKLDFQRLIQLANGWAAKGQELEKRGDRAGAAKALAQATEIRQHLEQHRQIGLAGLSQDEPNFDKPTEQMIQTAKMQFGIDLQDPQVAHYLKALQSEKKAGALKQHVEEEPPNINWVLIISIVVIIISYRMWATGTSKIIREDLFGFKAVEEVVESVADAAAAAASDGASGEL